MSGEYFLIFIRWHSTEAHIPSSSSSSSDDFILENDLLSKAEFRLGEDGQVKEMGVWLEAEMGDAKIWFRKAGAGDNDGYEAHFFTAESSTFKTAAADGRGASGGQHGQTVFFSRAGQGLAPLFA